MDVFYYGFKWIFFGGRFYSCLSGPSPSLKNSALFSLDFLSSYLWVEFFFGGATGR
jgi:hypothetical protein